MVAKSVMRLAVLLSLLATVSQAQVVSNFNSGADGWTCIEQGGTTVTPAYSAAGGNPGGYLSQDIVTTSLPNSNLWFWLAPAKFLGNRSLSYNQTLSFDLQQSQSGTDVSIFGDVVLTNTADGYTLYYPLPTKPATASWSSYTIALNETAGWKKGNLSGPAPTKDEMKRTLVNLSSLKIRAKYMGVVTGSYIAKLDNVVLQVATLGIAPVITSFTPRNGLPGTTVTITGSNFHTTIAQNSVYFSGVKATVTAATATQLTVNVPAGAPQGPITVVNTGTGLQAISTLHFYSRFDNNKDYGGRIIPSTMSIANQTVLPMSNSSNNFGGLAMGDFDQDGREDLVTTETATKKVYIYRSLGTMPVAPSSFATPVTLPGQVDGEVVTADFDGDGLLDIAGLYQGASFEYFNVFRNTSSPGSISFAAPVAVQLPNYTAAVIHADDLDGDGRIDLIATNGSSGSYIWVNQNLSSPGNIDFAGSILLGTPSAYSHIATGDIDNDGKKEMIVSYYSSNQFLVFPNASIPGTISMGPSFTITPSVATISDARLILADLDNDAKTDLAWAGYSATSLFVKKNQYSSGTLDATAFGADLTYTSSIAHPTHLASADINSDGLNDIVVVGFSDMAIYQNTGSGSLNVNSFLPGVLFEGAAGGDAIYATGPCIADFDGDNKPEVIMGYTNPSIATASKAIFIYRNESFPPPQITSLSSTAGNANTSFKIVGNYLNTYGDIPDSRVEGLRGALSAVSNTSATASAIAGNSDRHVGVTLHGLSAFAQQSFTTTFSSSGVLDNTTFPASVDFALSSSVAGDAMAIADYDNDNKPDVLIDDNITGKIFRNTQTTAGSAVTATTLTALTNTLTYVYHGKPADLDGDGWIDLVVNGSIYKNNSGTQAQPISFAAPVYFAGNSVNRLFPNHDLNLDGKPEVVYSTGNKVGISENFTRNNIPFSSSTFPSFTMSPVTINAGGTVTDLAITDFDGDGFEDIAMGVAGGAPTLAVMRNNGLKQNITASQFAAAVTFSSGNDPQYMAVADFDGDGKNDIAVGNNSSAFVTVYRNTSTSGIINFQRTDIPAPAGTVGIVADDLDGDGKAEIVIINQVSLAGSFSLFQNKSISGTISFGSAITYSLPNVPYALATADMNLDGKADILVARTGSPKAVLSVFENKISNASVITVTTPPASTTVCEGTGASLSTAASGTTNIVYQWQVYDKNAGGYIDVNDDATYSGYATGKLSMNTRGINGVISFRCKISGDLAPTIYTNVVTVTVNIVPPAPVTTSAQTCKAASVILQASGGTNGQYRWYTSATAVTPIAGQTQSAYNTPVVNVTTTYFVAINNGLCESTRTNVDAVVNPVTLAKPAITTQPALIRNTITVCDGTTTTLTAPAGFLYQWSDNETSQAINVTASGSYSVVVSDAQGCISPSSDAINVVINPCDNPPAISASTVSVALEGKVIVDLTPLVSDPDNNIDLSSLKIVQPPASGAIASINADHQLIIDYTGIAFSGEETILVEVCDLTNRCAQQQISIDVAGDIVVYGGISPNGDDKNAIFFIQFIDVLADTKNNHVTIYNRWGDAVFDTYNYDNVEHVFRGQNNSGADLSAGTYFYKIEFASGKKTHTGYLSLKR